MQIRKFLQSQKKGEHNEQKTHNSHRHANWR